MQSGRKNILKTFIELSITNLEYRERLKKTGTERTDMLFAGERIKFFPETDLKSYTRYIELKGFSYTIEGDEIVIGPRVKIIYDSEELGKLIFYKRIKKKMDRTELGKKLEVTGYAVYTWEIGRFQPKPMYLGMLREILGISQEELDRCRI